MESENDNVREFYMNNFSYFEKNTPLFFKGDIQNAPQRKNPKIKQVQGLLEEIWYCASKEDKMYFLPHAGMNFCNQNTNCYLSAIKGHNSSISLNLV